MERRTLAAPGHVIVQDNRTGKVSYWQKDYHQSASDGRGVSTADYIHAMYFFLRQAKCRDVLMIGCGGGTLATMLHSKGVKVTIVDIHKLSFDIARDYFHLPADIPCHVADELPAGLMIWQSAMRDDTVLNIALQAQAALAGTPGNS